MAPKNPCQGKHREFDNFAQKIGNFICSSCKFSDSKDTGHCDICCEVTEFFKVIFAYEIVAKSEMGTGKISSRADSKNTGNLQMGFEWEP